MDLWSLIKHSVSSSVNTPWIRYFDKEINICTTLTYHEALDLSESIMKTLLGLGRIGVIGLMFDENSSEIQGYFPSLLASLRLEIPILFNFKLCEYFQNSKFHQADGL